MTSPHHEEQLWLRLVSSLAIRHAGRWLAGREVGSRKARTLLALLAVRRGRTVAVDTIVDVLWEATPPRQPGANVATLVSRLRATLGAHTIMGGRTGYRLGETVGTDLHLAATLVARAQARLAAGEPSVALATARQALGLLGVDEVLADEPDATWAMPARASHADLQRRARHTAAAAALDTGDLPAAVTVARAAATADPLDETACRLLMRAYQAAGEPASALATYQELRAALARELGIDPSAQTRDLHMTILRSGDLAAMPLQ
jgi:DNA-binding SARP family transcriptional activator